MLVDVIRHQHAHLRAAVETLASLTAGVDERVRRASEEVQIAFRDGVPVWAAPYVATITALADDGRSAAALGAADLTRITTALVELYTLACREYWTA
jgi:hypothetical protein